MSDEYEEHSLTLQARAVGVLLAIALGLGVLAGVVGTRLERIAAALDRAHPAQEEQK